jgi:hypothetical protein
MRRPAPLRFAQPQPKREEGRNPKTKTRRTKAGEPPRIAKLSTRGQPDVVTTRESIHAESVVSDASGSVPWARSQKSGALGWARCSPRLGFWVSAGCLHKSSQPAQTLIVSRMERSQNLLHDHRRSLRTAVDGDGLARHRPNDPRPRLGKVPAPCPIGLIVWAVATDKGRKVIVSNRILRQGNRE